MFLMNGNSLLKLNCPYVIQTLKDTDIVYLFLRIVNDELKP